MPPTIPAEHLLGEQFPLLALPSTTGEVMGPMDFATGNFVLFIYPRTGRPDRVEPPEWSMVPGAKGCTAEACEFRDLAADYGSIGYRILGLSSQDTDYQREAAERLHLPYPLLSDPGFVLATACGLPTFGFDGELLHVRSTLVVRDRIITHAFLGITDAAAHSAALLEELQRWVPGAGRQRDDQLTFMEYQSLQISN
ncbi:peroxiredoxin [Paeniglutamicibacter psychrophenolicus]|uniref:peroxiredoxin n=1 Tax=Paeniglutamicibacter psychrophenolicus TaxID=257454 RepID=UPI00278798CD|nr:peroxiredoxin [Paeniglutamicibacter psychrophenolicus]MDQ0092736.1 peroxiredoxin [Paeniglutamicibacter psychrophenolicus]